MSPFLLGKLCKVRGWDGFLPKRKKKLFVLFSSVQSLSHVQLFETPWTAACQASLSITNSWSLLKLMSIKSVISSNHLILYCPLLLPPSIFLSIGVFSNESFLHIRWPKYWSFSLSISPSNEYSGLISFRMDWLGLLAVQGTLKSLLQLHSSKASILSRSAFFIVQLSHSFLFRCHIYGMSRRSLFSYWSSERWMTSHFGASWLGFLSHRTWSGLKGWGLTTLEDTPGIR